MVWYFKRISVTINIVSLLLVSLSISNCFAYINNDILSEIISGQDIIDSDNEANIDSIDPAPKIKVKSKTIKENLPLSAEDLAALSYQEGIKALDNKQELEATSLFKKSLEQHPKYHKSRMQLIEIYKNIGWTDEVEKLLIAGLDLDPKHSDFIKNLALLYQKKGQTRKALSILLSMPDPYAKQRDYMELLALVYLNVDQPDMAEKYYKQLLNSNKENSVWWLGLAISQDAGGKYVSATESFNQAKQLGRFNTEILDYINNKIKEINKY